MKIIVEGEAREIAALMYNLRERQSRPMMNPDSKAAGSALARLWEKRGFSCQTLAEKLGVSQSLIKLWEDGKEIPTAERCVQLSDVLQLPLYDIYLSLIVG